MEGGHPKCVQVRTRREGYHASCVRRHLHVRHLHLFSCFCLMVSCFICRNLTLPSFKKGLFVRNGFFFYRILVILYILFSVINPVQHSMDIYLIIYFTSIFTELVLYYCYCCCCCYLMLLL